MMKETTYTLLRPLFLQLLLLYLSLSLIRLFFYVYNASVFGSMPWAEGLMAFGYALRFDTAALLYVNALYLVLWAMPLPWAWRQSPRYQTLLRGVFVSTNFLLIVVELADVFYFPYSFRRMLWADLQMQQDFIRLLPTFLLEFWWAVLLLMGAWWGFWRLYPRLGQAVQGPAPKPLPRTLIFIALMGLMVLGMRGGWQLRPLMPGNAAQYVSNNAYAPLVSNASLSLIHSFQQQQLQIPNYFPQDQNPFRWYEYQAQGPAKRYNVVILALESMGQEYIGHFNPKRKGHTPFLDSLLGSGQGLLCSAAFANGTRSTQGIAAITAGLPSLMDAPLIFSPYQTNRFEGLASHLAAAGYHTAFFHPGVRGTMNFDQFTKSTGFQAYYGKENYPQSAHYDGNWGIWDHHFMDFSLAQMAKMPQPFFTTYFSINPHHPFQVPSDWASKPNQEALWTAVEYLDESLRQFWYKAQQQPWFEQTLFIITADHVGPIQSEEYYNRVGRYRIPLWFYQPRDTTLRGEYRQPCQQIQILPTVLDYLEHPLSFRSFAPSIFAAQQGLHLTFDAGLYQILDSSRVLFFDGKEVQALYDYQQDPFLQHDLKALDGAAVQRLLSPLQAAIQAHHEALIRNRWAVER